MNRYIYLLLFFIFGFYPGDVQKFYVSLDWHKGEVAGNSIGYTFTNAEYPDDNSHIPFYTRLFTDISSGRDFNFAVENPVFVEMEYSPDMTFPENIPAEIKLSKFRRKSGDIEIIEIRVPAVIEMNQKILLLKSFELKKTPVRLKSASVANYDWKSESVLKSGRWVKISISEKGIYKIPYSKLAEWGFSYPQNVSVYGAGGLRLSELPGEPKYDDLPRIRVLHGKNRGTNCMFFYAPGLTGWSAVSGGSYFVHSTDTYSEQGYFFLTETSGSSSEVPVLDEVQETPTHTINSFDGYYVYEKEDTNLIRSGRQWFGETFMHGSTRNFNFTLPDAVNAPDMSVRVNAASRSSVASQMVISDGQSELGRIGFSKVNTSDVTTLFADEKDLKIDFSPPSGDINLSLTYFGNNSNARAWLDFIEINYRRRLRINNGEALFFRDGKSSGPGNVTEFSIEEASTAVKVWDVTDLFNIGEVPVRFEGNILKGVYRAEEIREFAVFDPDGIFPEPEFAGEVDNQNLHGMDTPEFLIITHPNFISQAENLASFHREVDGMSVEVVQTGKVYNEFGSGQKDAAAIRNFIKMFYDRKEGLKYVLLFGDGSYDNRNIGGHGMAFIPTYQSENSLSPVQSFVSDDYFVILDDGENIVNGSMDLGIGRLPVSVAYQGDVIINKIRNYYSGEALGQWRNVVCFIGDDEDGGMHMTDSEKLANQINDNHGEFITKKIYFDAFKQVTGPGGESYPDVTAAINKTVKDGALILNYVGHANERFMADEKVLDVSHINSWSNISRLPIFVTATCEFSRFDGNETSAGEYILLNPTGGGVGLFSTTRLAYAISNFLLSRNFYNFVFEHDENDEPYRLGDIMRLAKINTISNINKRNFSLLADPALRLSYPAYNVVTTKINGRDAGAEIDTIGALQVVTVSGIIAGRDGNKIGNFSGNLIPTVYDKATFVKTLGNAGQNPVEFKVQENVIFKGSVEVKNGDFTFSFVIPKDISYNLGNGKIVYYAENGETDAHGVYDNFIIGGGGSQITDNEEPEIKLFIDSTNFVSGGRVNKNCLLLAWFSDDNGINTAGSGIGHDITAVLDDDYSNVIVLNDYYQSDPGDHTRGTVRFPLMNLTSGKHTLKVKAWDVANNSSEQSIEFTVVDNFSILSVSNYPNPVSEYTNFTFGHNQFDAPLDVIIEIFDITGKRIDYLKSYTGSVGLNSNPVRWNINHDDLRLRNGIYIYRITARNSDGIITSGAGKLELIR